MHLFCEKTCNKYNRCDNTLILIKLFQDTPTCVTGSRYCAFTLSPELIKSFINYVSKLFSYHRSTGYSPPAL